MPVKSKSHISIKIKLIAVKIISSPYTYLSTQTNLNETMIPYVLLLEGIHAITN